MSQKKFYFMQSLFLYRSILIFRKLSESIARSLCHFISPLSHTHIKPITNPTFSHQTLARTSQSHKNDESSASNWLCLSSIPTADHLLSLQNEKHLPSNFLQINKKSSDRDNGIDNKETQNLESPKRNSRGRQSFTPTSKPNICNDNSKLTITQKEDEEDEISVSTTVSPRRRGRLQKFTDDVMSTLTPKHLEDRSFVDSVLTVSDTPSIRSRRQQQISSQSPSMSGNGVVSHAPMALSLGADVFPPSTVKKRGRPSKKTLTPAHGEHDVANDILMTPVGNPTRRGMTSQRAPADLISFGFKPRLSLNNTAMSQARNEVKDRDEEMNNNLSLTAFDQKIRRRSSFPSVSNVSEVDDKNGLLDTYSLEDSIHVPNECEYHQTPFGVDSDLENDHYFSNFNNNNNEFDDAFTLASSVVTSRHTSSPLRAPLLSCLPSRTLIRMGFLLPKTSKGAYPLKTIMDAHHKAVDALGVVEFERRAREELDRFKDKTGKDACYKVSLSAPQKKRMKLAATIENAQRIEDVDEKEKVEEESVVQDPLNEEDRVRKQFLRSLLAGIKNITPEEIEKNINETKTDVTLQKTDEQVNDLIPGGNTTNKKKKKKKKVKSLHSHELNMEVAPTSAAMNTDCQQVSNFTDNSKNQEEEEEERNCEPSNNVNEFHSPPLMALISDHDASPPVLSSKKSKRSSRKASKKTNIRSSDDALNGDFVLESPQEKLIETVNKLSAEKKMDKAVLNDSNYCLAGGVSSVSTHSNSSVNSFSNVNTANREALKSILSAQLSVLNLPHTHRLALDPILNPIDKSGDAETSDKMNTFSQMQIRELSNRDVNVNAVNLPNEDEDDEFRDLLLARKKHTLQQQYKQNGSEDI